MKKFDKVKKLKSNSKINNGVKAFIGSILMASAVSSTAVAVLKMNSSNEVSVFKAVNDRSLSQIESNVNSLKLTPTEDLEQEKQTNQEIQNLIYDKNEKISANFIHHKVHNLNNSPTPIINWSDNGEKQFEVYSTNDKSPYSLALEFYLEELHDDGEWYWSSAGNMVIAYINDDTYSKPNITWNLNTTIDYQMVQQNKYRIRMHPSGVDSGDWNAANQAGNLFRNNNTDSQWTLSNGENTSAHKWQVKNASQVPQTNIEVVSPIDFKKIIVDSEVGFEPEKITLEKIEMKIGFDGDDDGHWNNTRTLWWNLKRQIASPTIKAYTSSVFKKLESDFKVEKIFMTPEQLERQISTNDWLDVIKIYDSEDKLVPKSYMQGFNVSFNKTNQTLSIAVVIQKNQNDYYSTSYFTIPIHVISLNNIFKVSKVNSSSEWNHLSSGEVNYHQNKPQTGLMLNEKFFNALKIISQKQTILTKFNSEISGWNIVGNDKAEIIRKINDYSINILNYSQAKDAYSHLSRISALAAFAKPDYFDELVSSNKWNTIIPKYDDYLYILQKSKVEFDHFIQNGSNKDDIQHKLLNISDLERTKIQMSDSYAHSNSRFHFETVIENLKLTGYPIFKPLDYERWKIWVDRENLQNLYDLRIEQNSGQYSVSHSYYYQTGDMEIGTDVSFLLEDGSVMDDKFLIVKSVSSDHPIGSHAYIQTRFFAMFSDGHKEFVTLENKNNVWTSIKYQTPIKTLDSTFDEKNIEYVFNQEINMIVNPYDLQGKSLAPGAIDSNTTIKYGINKIEDIFDGNRKVLEDWNDGKWSHSHLPGTGFAIFDGIFGADINGQLDPKGHLATGKHQLVIDIQNAPANFKSNYNLVIDKDPVKVKVNGVSAAVESSFIEAKENDSDTSTQVNEIYYSSGSINFEVKDLDIDVAVGELLASDGRWYEIPLNIRNVNEQGQWKLVINSTVDYSGFARVIITDQAGNKKRIYFKLDNSENGINPSLKFKDIDVLKTNKNTTYNQVPVTILTTLSSAYLFDPLVSEIKITKVSLDGSEQDVTDSQVQILPYSLPIPADYSFGQTIDSTHESLLYAGDELKPFLKNVSSQWQLQNKEISFRDSGLFKIEIKNKLLDDNIQTSYVYVKGQDSEYLKMFSTARTSEEELSNFENLPDHDLKNGNFVPQSEKSNNYFESTPSLNIFDFLISNIKIEFSYMWYTRFFEVPEISKEGKYRVTITNAFGQTITEEFLLLNKNLTQQERNEQGLSEIATNILKLDETAWWKGEVKWNVVSYEDKDHAEWEWNKFLIDAISHGLTPEEALKLYEQLKTFDNWDGHFNSITPDDMNNWISKIRDEIYGLNNWGRKLENKSDSGISGSTAGIIVGSILGGVGVLGTSIFMWIRRFKRQKIK